jgi:hypothetical protein
LDQDTEGRHTKKGTLAIVGSRYRVKKNKTRNTGNSRLKIESEDKQNKGHWQLSSLCILSLLLPVSLVLFVFPLYLDPTWLKIQSEDKQNKEHRQ